MYREFEPRGNDENYTAVISKNADLKIAENKIKSSYSKNRRLKSVTSSNLFGTSQPVTDAMEERISVGERKNSVSFIGPLGSTMSNVVMN